MYRTITEFLLFPHNDKGTLKLISEVNRKKCEILIK